MADAQGFGKTEYSAKKAQKAKQSAGFHNYAICSIVIPKDDDIPKPYVDCDSFSVDSQETYLTHLLQEMLCENIFGNNTYVDISAAGHRTTVCCEKDRYYFYDSNSVEAPEIECKSLAELAEQILNSYYAVLQGSINANKDIDHNYVLNFEAMQHKSQRIPQQNLDIFSKMLRVQQNDSVDIGQNTIIGETLLLSACEYMQDVGVEKLLNANVPHCKHYSGFYPLHRAVYNNNPDIIEAFINSNIDFSVIDKEGMTALHIAAGRGFSKTCLQLLDKAPGINIPDKAGYYPLHMAAQNNQISTAAILLNCVPNARNMLDSDESTALQIAAYNGSSGVVELLLNYNVDNIDYLDNTGSTALCLAAECNKAECVESLLRHGADPSIKNQQGWCAIHIAAAEGSNETLIKFGQLTPAHINAEGGRYQQTPLFCAVQKDKLAGADILLSYGADPNYVGTNGISPVVYAMAGKNKNMVDCLILHGAQINDFNQHIAYPDRNAAQGLKKNTECYQISARDI